MGEPSLNRVEPRREICDLLLDPAVGPLPLFEPADTNKRRNRENRHNNEREDRDRNRKVT